MLSILLIAALHFLPLHAPVFVTGDLTVSSGILNAIVPIIIVSALSFFAYIVRQIAKSNEAQAKIAQVLDDHDRRFDAYDTRLERIEGYFWRPLNPSATESADGLNDSDVDATKRSRVTKHAEK